MVKNQLTKQLEALFHESGTAHHRAFIDTDGDDPEWPLWYAEYLQEKLGKLLDSEFTKSEIVHLLLKAEKERESRAPESDWPKYYAEFFLEINTKRR